LSELNQPKLFPPTAEEMTAKVDAQILHLIMGDSGGPFGLTLGTLEKSLLGALRFQRGHKKAVSIAALQRYLEVDARTIKQAVRTLRLNFRLPIGSSKSSSGGGYYIMITPQDVAMWAKDVLDQVRAEVAVLRAAAGEQAGLEILGQLRNEALNAVQQEGNHA
jgi:predicted DNA-binding transcriptional regulator YafY